MESNKPANNVIMETVIWKMDAHMSVKLKMDGHVMVCSFPRSV
jgi:hypothetical protein